MSTQHGDQTYIGSELELFASATNWKRYLKRHITPYLGSRVLEVGAGLGSTTEMLCRGSEEKWVCLEPDRSLSDQIRHKVRTGELPGCCEVVEGTLTPGSTLGVFDSILYVDVLEHIAEDREEMERASSVLTQGGYLIVLSPAHQTLFTPFDRSIGHFRRYSRRTLGALSTPDLENVLTRYLDSVGLLASLANRFVLQSAMPSRGQIRIWNTLMVPLSRILDPLLAYRLGKSVLIVWRKRVPKAFGRTYRAPGDSSRDLDLVR